MPVTRQRVGGADGTRHAELAQRLADELRSDRAFGQPQVIEQEFVQTGLIGAKVVWDEFATVGVTDRSGLIRKAYALARPPEECRRLAFVSGYTVAEAVEAGLLSHWIRFSPPATNEPRQQEFSNALRELGATGDGGDGLPTLWLHSPDQAIAYREELVRRFPGTESAWAVGGSVPGTLRLMATGRAS